MFSKAGQPATGRFWRRPIAALVALLVGLGVVAGTVAPASADLPTGIVSATFVGLPSGDPPVVEEGDTYSLRIQYNNEVPDGYVLTIDLGTTADLGDLPLPNDAIESVVQNGTELIITFKDPFPTTVNQGVFDIEFTIPEVDSTQASQIIAEVDEELVVQDVIIKNSGDTQANVTDSMNKAVSPPNLNNYVSYDSDGNVVLLDSVLDQVLTYTLTVNTPAGTTRTDYPISDQLPDGLEYVAGSFATTLTTWEEIDGTYWNQSTTTGPDFDPTITDNSFSGTVAELTGPSIYVITYQVKVTDKDALEALLQAAHDTISAQGGTTTYYLTNTATFGPEDAAVQKNAHVGVYLTRGPVPGNAFSKTSDWVTSDGKNNQVVGIPAEDGTLDPAADLTYSFKANLSLWTGNGDDYTLQRNVVLVDTLNAAASWNTDADDFLTITGSGTIPTLTEVTCDESTTEATFETEDAGSWCVVGQTLFVNLGQDSTTNATVSAKVKVNTVADLSTQTPASSYSSVEGATAYLLPNTATYNWRLSGGGTSVSHNVRPVTMPDDTDGWHDTSTFDKSSTVADLPASAGQGKGWARDVTYTFTVGAGKGIDARTYKIVDTIDTTVFDIPAGSTPTVTGSYDGVALTADDYTLSWGTTADTADQLTIALSASGIAKVTDAGADKTWITYLELTTVPVGTADQAATLQLSNHAELQTIESTPAYYDDDARDVTSFGSEAEVRKRVWDSVNGEWTDHLYAQIDEDGNVVDDTYVYRIQFIPWGSYDGIAISDVVDNLPAGVTFLGFVSEDGVADGTTVADNPVDIGGNLEAVETDTDDGQVVTIQQQDGTVLDRSQSTEDDNSFSAYVAVQITDPLTEGAIVNAIGASTATIEAATYAIGDYVWVDADKDGIQDADEEVLEGVQVDLLRDGVVVATTTTDANGRYLFDNLPEGDYQVRFTLTEEQAAIYHYTGSNVSTDSSDEQDSDGVVDEEDASVAITEVISLNPDNAKLRPYGTGTGEYGDQEFEATMGIDPTWDAGVVKETYAVGDLVWIDADSDGAQDADETPLAGVTVTLLDGDGNEVATTTTDENGRYLFDNLPAGTYQVRFELTEEQAATYRFTTANESGVGDEADSDGEVESAESSTATTGLITLGPDNTALTTSYTDQEFEATEGIDPTWDAGVVFKKVSVGDYVWIDENRNGTQDGGEPPIPGVTLTISRTDGATVTNSNGTPKTDLSTTTDGNGKYLFTDLEVLPPGVHYVVTIDLTTVPADLTPTKAGQGDRATDSSNGSAESTDLTTDGASDLTLDFGFVRPEVLAATLSGVTVSTKSSVKQAETGSQLFDQVQVQGLAAGQTASATATLYGPYASKKDMTCASGKAVKTVSFTATSEWVE
ncbi:SdrD B-like domain-containing protein, partial [Nocardioides sp.]|uniref:SdrD B-like domain-containing protein n=1 Tax=Nocardioides sp. TaxID=35761 RepID=UPI0039E315CB